MEDDNYGLSPVNDLDSFEPLPLVKGMIGGPIRTSVNPDRFLVTELSDNGPLPTRVAIDVEADEATEMGVLGEGRDFIDQGDGRLFEYGTDGNWKLVAEGYDLIGEGPTRLLVSRCQQPESSPCPWEWLNRRTGAPMGPAPLPPGAVRGGRLNGGDFLGGSERVLGYYGADGWQLWDAWTGRDLGPAGPDNLVAGDAVALAGVTSDDRYLLRGVEDGIVIEDLDTGEQFYLLGLRSSSRYDLVVLPPTP